MMNTVNLNERIKQLEAAIAQMKEAADEALAAGDRHSSQRILARCAIAQDKLHELTNRIQRQMT